MVPTNHNYYWCAQNDNNLCNENDGICLSCQTNLPNGPSNLPIWTFSKHKELNAFDDKEMVIIIIKTKAKNILLSY
jgi:hypothetical protein